MFPFAPCDCNVFWKLPMSLEPVITEAICAVVVLRVER